MKRVQSSEFRVPSWGLALLLAFVFGAGLMTAPSASAQQYNVATVTNGVAIGAVGTNSALTGTITLTRDREVALSATTVLDSSGTSAITLQFADSIDGSSWESAQHTWSFAATGTTTNYVTTNINVGAVGFLRLTYIDNQNSSTCRVVKVERALKPERRATY